MRARVARRVMAIAMRVACNKEGKGESGKSNGDKCGGQATVTRAMVMAIATTWVAATVMRLVGDKEGKGKGKGHKGNDNNNEGGGQQRGQGRQGQ
jgi:hypothetical protein